MLKAISDSDTLETVEEVKSSLHLDFQKLLGRIEMRKTKLEREQRSFDMNIEVV